MTTLASDPAQRKTIAVGRFGDAEWTIAPNGRLIFFARQSIRYAGDRPFKVRGLPSGWLLTSLVASPRDPSDLLANAESNPHVPGGCRTNVEHGGVFLIRGSASTMLKAYNPCPVGSIGLEWSPDGRRILWFLGVEKTYLYISDERGRRLHKVVDHSVCNALWSPDGREIAWGSCTRAHVLDLATGASRFVATGYLEGWSPDGKDLALLRIHRPYYGTGFAGGSVVAVPVAGGPIRRLIRMPATKS